MAEIAQVYCGRINATADKLRLPRLKLRGGKPCRPNEYLGCGMYGCVYATESDSIVIKVTADKSEAVFAMAYQGFVDAGRQVPPGTVQVAAVRCLPDEGVVVIWREALASVEVEFPGYSAGILNDFVGLAFSESRIHDAIETIKLLSDEHRSFIPVTEAVLWWHSQGILLADTHSRNVGIARRNGRNVVVVHDVGGNIVLNSKWNRLRCQPLERA